jgi:hypothetical protein
MVKRILLAVAALIVLAAGYFVYKIGPGNIIGMIRYDQREKGKLQVGDRAPNVRLVTLAGNERIDLSSRIGKKPLVLIFGSFT